ncbi:MAG: CinA family protein [Anaerolineales bacterium]|nr:CinA family protein [Anaerolineales bacterium]
MTPPALPLEALLGPLLLQQKLTIATAESCTGGLVCHRLTNVPGCSAYVLGGIVSYANEVKEHVLGVEHATLSAQGAVSEAVARQMAQGARRVLGADVAVAITGIAGPGGGSADKPVGLTWLALAAPDAETAEWHVWPGDREANKAQSAEAALALVFAYLQRRAARP